MRWPRKAELRVVSILLAVLMVWTGRYFVNPDGISYLDLSDDFAAGRWSNAVNGHWSPAYPFVLSLWLRLFGSGTQREALGVHILNGLIFLVAVIAFEFFLRELRRSQLPRADRTIRPWALDLNTRAGAVCAWSIFLWCALVLITVRVVTPDMMIAAIVFAVAALVLRIREEEAGVGSYVAFGALLGLGYLTKSFMFWVSLAILAMSFLTTRRIRGAPKRHLLSFVIFAIVALPQIVALSRQSGSPRVSDSARFVYALKVNFVSKLWTGVPPTNGIPRHPMQVIDTVPLTVAFPTDKPNRTYPVWDDLSYWYDGMLAHFDVKQQLEAIERNVKSDLGIALKVIVPLLAVWFMRDRRFSTRYRTLTVIPWAVIAGYAFFYSQSRLIGVWLAVALISGLAGISLESGAASRKNLFARLTNRESTLDEAKVAVNFVTAICTLSILSSALALSFSPARDTGLQAQDIHWKVAENLRAAGVRRGARVALLGDESDIHWARLSGVQIAAQIPLDNDNLYWALTPEARANLDHRIAATGAVVMIGSWITPPAAISGWRRVPGTPFLIHPLN